MMDKPRSLSPLPPAYFPASLARGPVALDVHHVSMDSLRRRRPGPSSTAAATLAESLAQGPEADSTPSP